MLASELCCLALFVDAGVPIFFFFFVFWPKTAISRKQPVAATVRIVLCV